MGCAVQTIRTFEILSCLNYDAALMIVYDAPHLARLVGCAGPLADIFRL